MKERIKRFMDYKKISASDLADKIGVQRSNVSHVLNGRNKPASQFIEKMLLSFPDLDANWLLTGLGTMTKGTAVSQPLLQPADAPSVAVKGKMNPVTETVLNPSSRKAGEIERIVIFYSDRTFLDYSPGSH